MNRQNVMIIKQLFERLKMEKRPYKFIISRLLVYSGLSPFFIIKIDNFCMRFYPSSVSKELWVDKDYQNRDEIIFLKYLKSGDITVDVSANIGILTLTASYAVKE